MFDISIVSAFLAGLLSFVSPCILPIVPFYLSYLAGVGMNQISSDSEIDSATRRRAVLAAMFFAAGVITIFMGLGRCGDQLWTGCARIFRYSALGGGRHYHHHGFTFPRGDQDRSALSADEF